MQLPNQLLFLTDVSADSVTDGLDAGEILLGGKQHVDVSSVTKISKLCAAAGTAQVWKVTFAAPDNECEECVRKVGIRINLRRSSTFDTETYLNTFSSKLYSFVHDISEGTITNEDVAAEILAEINRVDPFTGPAAYVAATVPMEPEAITITSLDPDLAIDVFNVEGFTENVIEETTPQESSTLDPSYVARRFPLLIGFASIPGSNPDQTWQGCKNPCVIFIEGCLPAGCGISSQFGSQANAVHLHNVGSTPFTLEVWVNSDDRGYEAFLGAIEAATGKVFDDLATPEVES